MLREVRLAKKSKKSKKAGSKKLKSAVAKKFRFTPGKLL
jgi:hypothetical protein